MIDNRAVGKTIAALRQSRSMTQQQLAATLNVSHQAVSKWENGAALPDVQTLVNISQLFGITLEQLLSGELPPEKSPLEEPIRDIGNFFNSIVNGIFQPGKEDEAKAEDGAEDAATEAEAEGESPRAVLDLDRLIQMAPFMSKAAVDAMLLEHRDQLNPADIARFAPFISRECLEELIQAPEMEITWDILQKIAPFLRREMVDSLAKTAAKNGSAAKDTAKDAGCSGEEIGRAIGEMSQTISKGVEKVARHAVKFGEEMANGVTEAFNSIIENGRNREDRVKELRRAACVRALQDEKWDWLAEHIDEIDDEELRRQIAEKANSLGMHDWVLDHLHGYADSQAIDEAIEAGNWSWLGDHVWQFGDELQQRVALAAAQAENWDWLSTYAEQIALANCADQIAIAAYNGGARELALQLMEHCMNPEQREALANEIVAKEDYDFLEAVAAHLTTDYFGRLCLARAQEGNWELVKRFLANADPVSVERMTELAIAEGNFEAIDMLDPYLAR